MAAHPSRTRRAGSTARRRRPEQSAGLGHRQRSAREAGDAEVEHLDGVYLAAQQEEVLGLYIAVDYLSLVEPAEHLTHLPTKIDRLLGRQMAAREPPGEIL